MLQEELIDRIMIEKVLTEENQWFIEHHHRTPIGRENEDVVDNAYTRLCRTSMTPYAVVSDIYHEMRCRHARP